MNKKLKIAIFHNLSSGGALRVLHDHITFLMENGHHVDLFVPDTANDQFSPLKPVVNNFFEFHVKRSSFRRLLKNIINLLPTGFKIEENNFLFLISINQMKKTQKKIAEDINNKNYDIVLSEQDGLFTYSPALLKYIKKPTIYYCQQPMTNEKVINDLNFSNKKYFSMDFFEKLYLRIKNKWIKLDIEYAQYADNILANSFYSHEKILGIYGKNSQVSYLGIDNDIFTSSNFERENYVLSAGSILPDKGYDFLIKSIGYVNRDIRPNLYIVGYEASKEWLKYLNDLAEECDVNLKIFESVNDEKIAKLYGKAKIFAFTAFLNPFGLVSLEAMSCKTPVVAVKEGGIREIIEHCENGLLVQRDEEKFAKAISKLLLDKELWSYISNNSKKSVERYWTKKHSSQRLLNHMYRIIKKE